MAPELALDNRDFESLAVSPLRELGAYEAMWDNPGVTFKTLSEKFAAHRGALPSDFVTTAKAEEYADFVRGDFARRISTASASACMVPANIRRSCATQPIRSN